MRSFSMLAALALCAIASVGGAQQDAPRSDASFTWSGRVASGGTLRMRNVAGQINVERSTNGQVQVTGRKEWRRGDPADVRFDVVTEGNGVVICALWFESTCAGNERRADSPRRASSRQNRDNDVSVVFTVRLPAGVRLDATGISAGVSVTGVSGGVTAESVSGDVILVDVAGEIEAISVSGDVRVTGGAVESITATSTSGDVQIAVTAIAGAGTFAFESVSGNIEATLPGTLNADVRMTTISGRVSSDFSLATQAGWSGQRDMSGRIGAGGRVVTFETVSGNITLRRR